MSSGPNARLHPGVVGPGQDPGPGLDDVEDRPVAVDQAVRLVDDVLEEEGRVGDRREAGGDLAQRPLVLDPARELGPRAGQLVDEADVGDGHGSVVGDHRKQGCVALGERGRAIRIDGEDTDGLPSMTSGAATIARTPKSADRPEFGRLGLERRIDRVVVGRTGSGTRSSPGEDPAEVARVAEGLLPAAHVGVGTGSRLVSLSPKPSAGSRRKIMLPRASTSRAASSTARASTSSRWTEACATSRRGRVSDSHCVATVRHSRARAHRHSSWPAIRVRGSPAWSFVAAGPQRSALAAVLPCGRDCPTTAVTFYRPTPRSIPLGGSR